MKLWMRLLIAALVLAIMSPMALADCKVVAASAILDGVASAPSFFVPVTSGVPATMAAGAPNQLASSLAIYDDGTLPACFQFGQQITVSFNLPLSSPTAPPASPTDFATNYTLYDSAGATGLVVTVDVKKAFPASLVTITVQQPGTRGDPTLTGAGSGFVLKNFKVDTSSAPAGSFATATVSTSLIGALHTPGSVTVGSLVAAGPVVLSPTTLSFGDLIVGATSAPQTAHFTNKGTLPVTINNITATSSFGASSDCGTSLAPNATCTVSVTFTPAGFGTQSGTVTIFDNATGGPHTISVTGNGIASPGAPAITALLPTQVIAGGPDFTLRVTGTSFAPGTTVYWNGAARVTTYLDVNDVEAAIPASDIVNPGTASITVLNGSTPSAAATITIVTNPLPSASFRYTVPHVVQGAGFVTKLTLSNLSSGLSSNVTVNFLTQAGTLAGSTQVYTIPARGTLRIATPETARFGPSIVQTAVIGSQSKLAVNVFFEFTDSTGKNIVNTIGFNNVVPATDISIPVEFERATAGGAFTRTVGLALANTTDTPANVKLQMLNSAGAVAVGTYSVELAPYGQTAMDLSQVAQFAAAVNSGNFVGTLVIQSTRAISAIALGDDIGPFASTPPVSGRSTLRADDIVSICPSAADILQMNADFPISFESDPTAGTLVCRAAEGSQDLTLAQKKAYQALLVLKNAVGDAPFPFATTSSPYQWLKSVAHGIRFRGDIAYSGCCDSAGVLDISLNSSSPALYNLWLGPAVTSANVGMDTLVTDMIRAGRVAFVLANGSPAYSCSTTPGATKDTTISEMGGWAAALDMQDFIAQHTSTYFDDTQASESASRYRDVANANALAYVTGGQFCSVPGISSVQPAAGTTIDFGTQAVGDPTVLRTVTVNTANGTPFSMGASSIAGTEAADFSIVSDNCTGRLVPPDCSLVVAFKPSATGARNAQLTVGSAPNFLLNLTGTGSTATPVPNGQYTYLLPHIVTGNNGGNGYVTKITLSNLVNFPNDVQVRYISQSGATLKTDSYTIAAGGALRISTPESSRFAAATTQWAVVSSRQPLLANLFFEVENSSGAIVNTVGFNAAPPLTDFTFPVEFEPTAAGTPGGRTAGLAMANPGGSTVAYTLKLYNNAGGVVTTVTGTIPAYGQVGLDLSQNATIAAVLPKANFVGSVEVITTGPVSAIALEDDFGPFSATPVVSQ